MEDLSMAYESSESGSFAGMIATTGDQVIIQTAQLQLRCEAMLHQAVSNNELRTDVKFVLQNGVIAASAHSGMLCAGTQGVVGEEVPVLGKGYSSMVAGGRVSDSTVTRQGGGAGSPQKEKQEVVAGTQGVIGEEVPVLGQGSCAQVAGGRVSQIGWRMEVPRHECGCPKFQTEAHVTAHVKYGEECERRLRHEFLT